MQDNDRARLVPVLLPDASRLNNAPFSAFCNPKLAGLYNLSSQRDFCSTWDRYASCMLPSAEKKIYPRFNWCRHSILFKVTS